MHLRAFIEFGKTPPHQTCLRDDRASDGAYVSSTCGQAITHHRDPTGRLSPGIDSVGTPRQPGRHRPVFVQLGVEVNGPQTTTASSVRGAVSSTADGRHRLLDNKNGQALIKCPGVGHGPVGVRTNATLDSAQWRPSTASRSAARASAHRPSISAATRRFRHCQ